MYKGTSGHNPVDPPKTDEKMKVPGQGNTGDQIHRSGGQSGSWSQSGSSSQGNFEPHKGSGMEHSGQMNQMQKGGALNNAGRDSNCPDNRENHAGPGQNGCPGMMKQGSNDHKMGPHGDTCPCMRNLGMEPGHGNRYSGHQDRENQDQQTGNFREPGKKLFTQGPGHERMNGGAPGDRSFSGEKQCQGFDGKEKSLSHHRFQGNPDESGCSGQTNQEHVYLVAVEQR